MDRLPLARSQLGTWPAIQARALTGKQTCDLSVCRLMPSPLSHTSQGLISLIRLMLLLFVMLPNIIVYSIFYLLPYIIKILKFIPWKIKEEMRKHDHHHSNQTVDKWCVVPF